MTDFTIVVNTITGSRVMTEAQASEIVGKNTIQEMKAQVVSQDCPFEIRKINGATVQVSRFGNVR